MSQQNMLEQQVVSQNWRQPNARMPGNFRIQDSTLISRDRKKRTRFIYCCFATRIGQGALAKEFVKRL